MKKKQIPRIAVIGETGVGRSSTLNALFDGRTAVVAPVKSSIVSPVRSSRNILHVANGSIQVEELPRFGETIASQRDILQVYRRILGGVDVALWILNAQSRSFILAKEMAELNLSRSVFALNKVDLVYPGSWDHSANMPNREQLKTIRFLIGNIHSKICEVVPSWHGKVIGYSAYKHYNLRQLQASIIEAAPEERQHLFSSLAISATYNEDDWISNRFDANNEIDDIKGKNIFLCHASEDKAKVHELYRLLKKDGFSPWLDIEDLLPGQEWQLRIPQVVKNSDIVLVCLSRSAITKSGYVQKEIRFALDIAEQQPEGKIYLIPLRLEDCKVPERLTKWQWVNYYEQDGYSRLVRALRASDDQI